MNTRRTFLKVASGSLASTLAGTGISLGLPSSTQKGAFKVGLISDLHFCKRIPDALDRFNVFMREVDAQKPDYIIQLGDFCHFEKRSEPLMEVWNAYSGDKYHVLGNHDMDLGTKDEIMGLWGMEKRYYDFDRNGWKFIVLDMNHIKKGEKYIPYSKANFYVDRAMRTWMDPEQLEWLDKTLESTDKPVLIYTHQPFADPSQPKYAAILDLIKKHEYKHGLPKVRAVICGHQHSDWHREVHGTHHICINSVSYKWSRKEQRPLMYEESLYAFMEVKNGRLFIKGQKTKWVEKPEGVDSDPAISDRSLELS
jgi:UDP-2,3-diacylglucosamine pyrophosphatase LpxH